MIYYNNKYKYIYIYLLIICIFVIILINYYKIKYLKPGYMRNKHIQHDIYGDIYTFDENDLISVAIQNNNIWEEQICQLLAKNYVSNTDVLDIGANIGLSSIRMNQLNPISPGCKIHLFEPQHDVFSVLEYNTKDLPRILYNFALSDKNRILNFSQKKNNIGATIMNSNENYNNIHVSSTYLDNLTFERPISVVKMDVEGSEEFTLIGGLNFFEKYKPTLIIEIWSSKENAVFSVLEKMNYVQTWNQSYDYVFKHRSLVK